MPYEVNADGLNQRYGTPRNTDALPGRQQSYNGMKTIEFDFTFDNYPVVQSDLDGDGNADGFTGNDVYIPAGSFITAGYIMVEDGFAGGTSWNMGLREVDGTSIDVDGLDAAVAAADLSAGDAVVMDGALVGGTSTVGSDNAYVVFTPTGTFTAGKAKVVLQYLTTKV